MKVYLGPYNSWVRPTRWLYNLLKFFYPKEKHEWLRGRIVGNWDDEGYWPGMRVLKRLENWADNLTPRKVKVKIHEYDTWNMADNLALIILPMLKQLKEKKQGAPFTDDEDVPEYLRSTAPPVSADMADGHTDANHFARWNWIMDEMINAVYRTVDDSWEELYYSGRVKREAFKAEHERIANGFRLFGKYFQALWD